MTFSTTAFSSARRWLAVAAVFALSLPPPAAASGFYAPSSTLRLPDAVLDAAHDVAYPSGTAPVRLSDYHHAKRDDAEKFVVVVATYFTGCTPGRADYPSFTKYVTALRARVNAGDLPGNVEFVVSLKNGVNEGVARAWAEIDGADDVSDSLVIVDDRHRALVYQLFDAAVHPAYAVLDHCMRYRALLPSIAETLNAATNANANSGAEENGGLGNDLVSVVEALLRETETNPACPGDDAVAPLVAPAGARVKAEESAHVPGAVPSTDACVPGLGTERSVARVGAPAGSNFLAPFASPRALAFHPVSGDLWVANQDTDALTVLRGISAYANDGAVGKNPRVEASTHRLDRARYHYMDAMAALAFGSDAAGAPLVTCQESENDYDGSKAPNRFMGPSLYDTVKVEGTVKTGGWPRGAEIYVDQAGEACDPESVASSDATCFMTHTDMLHATPLCAGIAHDPEPATPFANVFWVNDGLNETLVRYDFEQPHGPGSLDHALANVRRFPEISLKRVPGVPGHVVVDAATRTVFVADVGGGRVVAVHADSGVFTGDARNDLGGNFTLWSSPEPSFEYSLFGCASHYAFVSNLDRPSGLALWENVLYVGEHGTGKILAFHKTTGVKLGEVQTGASRLFGLAVQPETGDVFFADGDDADAVGFVNVTAPCGADDSSSTIPSGPAMAWPSSSSSDTGVPYCVDTSAESPFADALNVAVHTISHDDGYLNMTPLGPGYGASDACLACSAECDNDMLLMSGFLCHACLPDNCRGGVFDAGVSKGTCVNLIGRGYECVCDEGYRGDHCQFRSRAETRFLHRTLATAIAAAAAVVSLR